MLTTAMSDSVENTGMARFPSLAGKGVFVSGGGSGIGAALVEAFALQGAKVLFVDIADEPSRALVAKLDGKVEFTPRFVAGDLRDLAFVRTRIGEAHAELGRLDILVNNAANDDRHHIADVTPEYWDERMAVNLRHLFFASQAAIPFMEAAGAGVILNFGSISWHLALDQLSLYQTAKAGIEGMTRAMARELGEKNIRVCAIVPGNVQTPRQERWYTPEGEREILDAQCLKARVQPEDVAALALFLASDDARMCTGHEYFVDAGWR
ncbi:SDR family NAD(P)-dependent oxidoreductase [Novosphingobium silvae]|jgi:NAD(P)-dependent dehydrogenase (short-subunit alcohol dehydrogenase family)|nr:SDR family oxidoreductase [Novosphingobium silvae]